MKAPKAYVIETVNGSTKTKTDYATPFATCCREAKERIMALANSGEPAVIAVVEHVFARTYSTDGKGDIKVR